MSSQTTSLPLLPELRSATKADHRRAESNVSFADITDQPTAYAQWLGLQLRWHTRVLAASDGLDRSDTTSSRQQDWAAVYRRVSCLRADLAQMQANIANTPPIETEMRLATTIEKPTERDAWRLGVLYVVLGSGMGAQIIRRTIRNNGHDDWATRFLDGVADREELARWRRFVADAEAVKPTSFVHSAIEGAHWAFEQFTAVQTEPTPTAVTPRSISEVLR